MFSVYAPDIFKAKEDVEVFYETLQGEVNKPPNDANCLSSSFVEYEWWNNAGKFSKRLKYL